MNLQNCFIISSPIVLMNSNSFHKCAYSDTYIPKNKPFYIQNVKWNNSKL